MTLGMLDWACASESIVATGADQWLYKIKAPFMPSRAGRATTTNSKRPVLAMFDVASQKLEEGLRRSREKGAGCVAPLLLLGE